MILTLFHRKRVAVQGAVTVITARRRCRAFCCHCSCRILAHFSICEEGKWCLGIITNVALTSQIPWRVSASPRGLWTTLRNSSSILPDDSREEIFQYLIYYCWPFFPSYFKSLTFSHFIFFLISPSTSFLPIRRWSRCGSGGNDIGISKHFVLIVSQAICWTLHLVVLPNPHNNLLRQVLLLSWFCRREGRGRRH